MKKLLFTLLLCMGFTFSNYSQDKTKKDTVETMRIEELPAVIINRAGADFSVYITDKHPDKKVTDLQEKFVAYDLGKDYEGYEMYLLIMKSKDRSLSATYNEKGKLIRVVENYKNVRMPNEVIYSIYKNYPGWSIVNDKFLYSQEEGDIKKKEYSIKIKKGDEIRKLTVHDNGEILRVK